MAYFFIVVSSGCRNIVLDAGELGPLMTKERPSRADPLPDPLPDIPQPDIGASAMVAQEGDALVPQEGDHAMLRAMSSSAHRHTLGAQAVSDILRSSDTRPRLRVRHLLRVKSGPCPPRMFMPDLLHLQLAMLKDMERRGFTFELAERRN
jgi:hypothetical protein